jgi:hypothetical protein
LGILVIDPGLSEKLGFPKPACLFKKNIVFWAPAADVCNPSYSGGRDQRASGSKSSQANSSGDPIWNIPNTKKDWWSGSRGRAPA